MVEVKAAKNRDCHKRPSPKLLGFTDLHPPRLAVPAFFHTFQPANSLQAKCFFSRAATGSELVAVPIFRIFRSWTTIAMGCLGRGHYTMTPSKGAMGNGYRLGAPPIRPRHRRRNKTLGPRQIGRLEGVKKIGHCHKRRPCGNRRLDLAHAFLRAASPPVATPEPRPQRPSRPPDPLYHLGMQQLVEHEWRRAATRQAEELTSQTAVPALFTETR